MEEPQTNRPPLPQDIIRLICQQILHSADPAQLPLLIDPYFKAIHPFDNLNYFRVVNLEPNPIVQAQQSLKSLCLVSRQWNLEARKFLWASGIQFGLPKSFETVVKTVDPIGHLFDGQAEPSWLRSPPASRHSSPIRTVSSTGPPVSVSSAPCICCNLERTGNRQNARCSVSLKQQGDNYILQPHSTTHSKDAHCLSEESHASDRDNRAHSECTIIPIRGRVALESLSQAFRRTSVSSSRSRPRREPPASVGGWPDGHQNPRLDPAEEEDQDDDEFIFDHRINDLFNPAPYITSISFSKYRSHGMRRSVAEGQQARFVTSERLLRLLKSTRSQYSGSLDQELNGSSESGSSHETSVLLRKGKLQAVGFSEYMDSAISKAVLDEILLRGGVELEYQVMNPDYRSEDDSVPDLDDGRGHARSKEELPTAPHCIKRRLESSLLMETPIEALDLCGCISSKVRTSITDFILDHALSSPYLHNPGAQTRINLVITPAGLLRSTRFPYLTRLGLSGVMILDDLELADFLSGFINLRDLDLSHTRAGPNVLHTLQLMKKNDKISGDLAGLRPSFRSLNLAKCKGLTKESLVGFLCGNPVESSENNLNRWEDPMESIGELEELSLHGDLFQPTPLDAEALDKILTTCPALLSGKLTTLDISSAKIRDSEFDLKEKMPDQPSLLQFGIGSCPHVSLTTVQYLLKQKMRSVEVLDISMSCWSARHRVISFGDPCYAISVGKLHGDLINQVMCLDQHGNRVSNLRVIELDDASLEVIRGGANGWKVAYGKRHRGWYVDLSSQVIMVRDQAKADALGLSSACFRHLVQRNDASDPSELADWLKSRNLELMHSPSFDDRQATLEDSLEALIGKDQTIRHTEIGWMSRKTEILHGSGLLGRQDGLYGFHAYAC